MTPSEEFDAAAQEAQEMFSKFPLDDIKQPSAIQEWFDKLKPSLWKADAGVNAARLAILIADSIKVLIATKSLSNDSEKAEFANSIRVLQSHYFLARKKAMEETASRYTITAQLRAQAGTLNKAYKKVIASTAILNQLGDAIDGLTSLVGALR
ncbi:MULTISPECIES: hypothetical protein [Agrobacterium]|uniref:Uncharacterized protein n=2 Tax=Agrobacterium tumefaciens complex TaxID=1183400 RepID=A0AAE6BKK7_AGRTU|nr:MULTISPECIES: hypothetical protein [Agrobacterium]ASK40713.1 hypothetical protein [Agrobacterium genomosp. 6]ASK40862.1 hypothetical protein [Agrobacterium genomosp. 6]ASK41476.1 hypothetical protein [Agrobacterium genomosp. 6]QCL77491.1 hypothetical protein CFBP5499_28970 [Agrobacterium tumefaciens]QCL82979.1 hypothetical protein CFBP5877_28135 [Agrobacterium tumefaciens]